MDPPRPEVPDAVAQCASAGIQPVMITGDHPGTALAIALRLGIAEGPEQVLTGVELAKASEEELVSLAERIRVYARVSPEQKIQLVKALQASGQFVAMTGDGVNDAPALKRADIGIAMGRGGTDVAREAAAMVLLDDNFATIVAAVREGRRIFDNIRKFIKYTMTSNSGEIWTLALAPLFGMPLPLLPIHILWINLVTDGLPGLALTTQRAEQGIMRRPPRPPRESMFSGGVWQHILFFGLLIAGLTLAAQFWAIQSGVAAWQTMAFTVLTFTQLVHVIMIRNETDSIFATGLLQNRALLGAVGLTVLLQLLVIYVPLFNTIFRTAPLGAPELAICLGLPLSLVFFNEAEKWLMRRGILYSH
jgi:Ca2+-transporting ATPase